MRITPLICLPMPGAREQQLPIGAARVLRRVHPHPLEAAGDGAMALVCGEDAHAGTQQAVDGGLELFAHRRQQGARLGGMVGVDISPIRISLGLGFVAWLQRSRASVRVSTVGMLAHFHSQKEKQ